MHESYKLFSQSSISLQHFWERVFCSRKEEFLSNRRIRFRYLIVNERFSASRVFRKSYSRFAGSRSLPANRIEERENGARGTWRNVEEGRQEERVSLLVAARSALCVGQRPIIPPLIELRRGLNARWIFISSPVLSRAHSTPSPTTHTHPSLPPATFARSPPKARKSCRELKM